MKLNKYHGWLCVILKPVFIIAIVAVAMIGMFIPNVFAEEIMVGDSIIQEKDCVYIGNEIDPNIECKITLVDWFSMRNFSYDEENNILYKRAPASGVAEEIRYVGVDMNTYEIISDVDCIRVTTGTYVKEQTIPCEPKIESLFDQTIGQVNFSVAEQGCKGMSNNSYPSDYGFHEYYDDELIFVWYRACSWSSFDHHSNAMTMGVFDYNGELVKTLGSFPASPGSFALASNTDQKYIYYSTQEDHPKLIVNYGENFSQYYTYNFPPLQEIKNKGWFSEVFHNEKSNKVYYFIEDNCSLKTIDNQLTCTKEKTLYTINGMGSKSDYNVDLSEESYTNTKISKNELTIASFVDQSKDPQHYIDRYFNESTYKEWFDENYPQYISIYEAVGLSEPIVEQTNEPEYVPEPAFTPEPIMEQEVNCGPGTESVNGICEVIQTTESEEGGGCLIATATYGSELAPQVQQLRELRDNQLMNTESGTTFMGIFNDVYYSFSPIIADYERENPYFKEAVKLAITPMISSLSLMENANSEFEVLRIGISVIMLNLGMYLGVPAIVIVGIRKKF